MFWSDDFARSAARRGPVANAWSMDDVRLLRILRARVSGAGQMTAHQLGVGYVHLAAVGFDVDGRHRSGEAVSIQEGWCGGNWMGEEAEFGIQEAVGVSG